MICGTYAEEFERFITFTDPRRQDGEKKKVGCPIKVWMKDLNEWTGQCTHEKVNRAAEDRKR